MRGRILLAAAAIAIGLAFAVGLVAGSRGLIGLRP